MHPGRKLNVVIGPNGTGKSTVVCAIVLGLAGNPKLVGRETNVGAYVKEGRDKARIEIVLKDVGSKTISIVRQFDRLNKSIWTLNGKHANQAEVLRLTKSLNIQVHDFLYYIYKAITEIIFFNNCKIDSPNLEQRYLSEQRN